MQVTNVTIMVKPLPKWVMRRYSVLWSRFGINEFTFEQAHKALNIDKPILSLLLSEMKRAGWIKVSIDPRDSRKRLYELVELEKILKCMAKGD